MGSRWGHITVTQHWGITETHLHPTGHPLAQQGHTANRPGLTRTSVSLIQFVFCKHQFVVLDKAGVELHSEDELHGAVLLLVEALDLQSSSKGQGDRSGVTGEMVIDRAGD